MKKFIVSFFLLTFSLISAKAFSQPWLPQPVKSPYLDALEGTWISEPYEFMGNNGTNTATYKKILNGQYMEVDMNYTDNKGFNYQAKEIITPGKDGSMTGAFYDIFAKGAEPTTYTGSQDGDKISLTSVGGTGSKQISIDGNTMIQDVSFTMGTDPGLPVQKIKIKYKKQ